MPDAFNDDLTVVDCPRCDGDGEEPGAPVDPCEIALCDLCGGKGEVLKEVATRYLQDEAEGEELK
jgi:DnaJ-class molecular chaperone